MATDERGAGPTAQPRDVDVTLIDEMLRMSPEERLRQNDRMVALVASLQEAFAAGTIEWRNRKP